MFKDIINACTAKTINITIKDVSESLFSLLVDESHSVLMNEKVSIVLRCLNNNGHVVFH